MTISPIENSMQYGAFLFLISLLIISVAAIKGYFKLQNTPSFSIPFYTIPIGFLLYFAAFILIGPFIVKNIGHTFSEIEKIGALIFLSLSAALILIYGFFKMNPILFAKIWKPNIKATLLQSLKTALTTLLIAIPVITFISWGIDLLIKNIWHISKIPEQLIINYLMLAKTSPLQLFTIIFSIVVLAPFVEEFLFRGLIHNYIKKKGGKKTAILVTSLLFGFFHYSSSQGIGNYVIIAMIVILGFFLSLIYEKTGSLITSILFHMFFNLLSTLLIFL